MINGFICRGDSDEWDLTVNNDWADINLFARFQSLAEKNKTKGRFTSFDPGGQEIVLGFYTPEELSRIREATGLDIVWIESLEAGKMSEIVVDKDHYRLI